MYESLRFCRVPEIFRNELVNISIFVYKTIVWKITVLKSKTGVYKTGHKVCIARTLCDKCPVNILIDLKKVKC